MGRNERGWSRSPDCPQLLATYDVIRVVIQQSTCGHDQGMTPAEEHDLDRVLEYRVDRVSQTLQDEFSRLRFVRQLLMEEGMES